MTSAMPERPRVLQMGPDPAIGGGMAAALRGLLGSPLGERYQLDVVPTYRGTPTPLAPRSRSSAGALLRLIAWSLRGRGRIVHVHATVRGSMYRKSVCVLVAKALRRRVVFHVHSGAGDIAAFARQPRPAQPAPLPRRLRRRRRWCSPSPPPAPRRCERAYGVTGVEVVPNAGAGGGALRARRQPRRRGPRSPTSAASPTRPRGARCCSRRWRSALRASPACG